MTGTSGIHYKQWVANGQRVKDRYSDAAVALHWITALLIAVNLLLGLSMVPLPLSPRKLQWYAWHKWVGLTVFLLTWARLAWRWARPMPLLASLPAWQRTAATFSHTALYVLMLVIPVSGWLYSSATGVQVVYLGLVPLPDAVEKDKVLAEVLKNVHVSLNVTMALFIAVHVAAAFKHHFIDRDEVLARMWPGLKSKELVR